MTKRTMLLGLGGAAIASGMSLGCQRQELGKTDVAADQPSHVAEPIRAAPGREQPNRSWVDQLRGPQMVEVTVPASTRILVALDIAIDSSKMKAGDRVDAKLVNAVTADGHVVAKAGSAASGRVVQIDESGRVKGREQLTLRLEDLETVNGHLAIETGNITLVAEGTKQRDAAVIGGAAAVGAIIGGITKGGGGAAKGTAVGGAGGAAVVLATKGEDIELSAGHQLSFALTAPLTTKVESERSERP